MVSDIKFHFKASSTFLFRLPLVEYILANYKDKKTITVRELDLTDNNNFRPTFTRVRDSKSTNILLCSSSEDLAEILLQAQQVGIMTNEYNYIITSLDMHTIDLKPFQYSSTNITGMRLVIPNDPMVNETMLKIQDMYEREYRRERSDGKIKHIHIPEGLTAETLTLNTALRYDAISLFHQVLKNYQHLEFEGVSCDDRKASFDVGTSIFNSMRSVMPFKGLSGEIQFDPDGNRVGFTLEILELSSAGMKTIGTWDETEKIVSTRGSTVELEKDHPNIFFNKTFIVLTTLVSKLIGTS